MHLEAWSKGKFKRESQKSMIFLLTVALLP
jgi:hypothetical protein